MNFLCWEETCVLFACNENIISPTCYQSVIMTVISKQSQIEIHASSPCAKQEAYWTELQRANESLREDLPAGLEPALLGTERSVVSSMPPNEMHRVIWLTICIFLRASRACDGDARPDMRMSSRSVFTAHKRVSSVSSWWGNDKIYELRGKPPTCCLWSVRF